tara:strand:+ start:423 stop:2408 length:1986 start_codon:yes stop_codon:yes gene_type:complete
MSLIILSSKGSDPEDFSNFITEQIKFPSDAEVCLVSSHINRKMMVQEEVRLEAGANTLGFQFGSGTLDALRLTTGYTPHSPSAWEISETDSHFPIIVSGTEMPILANAFMNEAKYQPISPLVGGWQTDITGGKLTFKNTMKVPDAPSSLGNTRVEDILIQPGYNQIIEGGINNTYTLPSNASVVDASIGGGALYDGWVACAGEDTACFVDNDPVWNTDTGGRMTIFTQPASTASSLVGGAWTWGFAIAGGDEKDITGLRGGIFSNAQFSGQTAQNQSVRLSKITGGTDYCLWWEISSADLISGALRVTFYARNPRNAGCKDSQRDDRIEWGSANIPGSALTNGVRLGMRPVQRVIGGENRYVIEGFYGRADNATNAWVGATRPISSAPGVGGYIEVTDPEQTTYIQGKFDLYRHLPLRMGCNTQSDANPVLMNAPHHARTTHIDMPAGTIATSPDFTFCLGDITPTDQAVKKFDASVRQTLRKATIGSALGFNNGSQRVTATLMVTTGAPAEIALGWVIPVAKPLVVTLPDLPITGFYGNSAGELGAGTLNLNSGGSSSAILGVIPYGDKPFRDPTAWTAHNSDGDVQKGEFFSCPMENYIQLNNPAPFSVSSLRVKITDALGQKPEVLDPNTTITIKIRNSRSSRDSMRQGGLASNFRNK